MSKTALTVLGLLAEQPMHGYEIIQTIKKREIDMWLRISPASVYNTLGRLELKGYIAETTVKIGKTPERHVYNLTARGLKYLQKLVEKQLKFFTINEYPYGLAIAFLQYADTVKAVQSLKRRLKLLEKIYQGMDENREKNGNKLPFNWYALLLNGMDHVNAEINQLKFLLSQMEEENEIKTG